MVKIKKATMFPSSYFLFTLIFSLTLVSSLPPATPQDKAEEMIEASLTNMAMTYEEIETNEENATDPVVHEKYKRCGVLYISAYYALANVSDFLYSGEYQKMPAFASIALDKVDKCDKIFTPAGTETEFKSVSEMTVRDCRQVLSAVKGLASGN